MHQTDLTNMQPLELIRLHRSTLRELFDRGIIRTMNAPQGDYAEALVAEAYRGELAPNSEKSWDVLSHDDRRIQVKSRVVVEGRPGTRQMSFIRSWDFDQAVLVFFSDDDLSVTQAVELEVAVVKEHSRYVPHVNGWRLVATPRIVALGQDVTAVIRSAALSMR